jgi:hypothetical protein
MLHFHTGKYKVNPYEKAVEINFYKYDVEQVKAEVIHNILLIDLSWSITYELHKMKESLKQILKKLKGYVSIICYAGHGQSYILFESVECNKTSYKMNSVYEKIEHMETIGLTVMSEPLRKSLEIQNKLNKIVDMTNVILFTDGCIVTYDIAKEEKNCFDIVDTLNKTSCIVSTIGFGQYYDKTFLKRISKQGYNCHIDDIKEYKEVVNNIINNSKYKTKSKILKSENIKMMNLTTGECGYSLNVYPQNIVAVISDTLDFECEIKLQKKIPDEVDNFYYVLAKEYLTNDEIDFYESIVRTKLGDIALFKKTKDSYSFIEKGNALKLVNECIQNEKSRFKDGRKFIIEDDNENDFSVLDVISSIMQDKESKLYWNRNTEYHRIGLKTNKKDDGLEFIKNPNKELFPIIDCAISDSKLNINVKVKYDGKVVNSKKSLNGNANIFRQYNLINNGNLNVRYLYTELSDELYKKLKENRIKVIIYNIEAEIPVYRIDFDGLKTANKRILNSLSRDELINSMLKVKELKCQQNILNKEIKDLLGVDDKLEYVESMSEIEKQIRRELSIDENGTFRMDVEKSDEEYEVYKATHLEWSVKINEKDCKERYKNDVEKAMGNFDKKVKINLLIKFREQIRKQIRQNQFKINCIRIASAMMNRPIFAFDAVNEKYKKSICKITNRNMIVGEKVEIATKIFDNTIFTQKKWNQLLKCN